MLTREQAQKITEKALAFSTFPECDIGVNSSEHAFIRFALNDVTTSGFTVEQSMSISSVRDGQSAFTLTAQDKSALTSIFARMIHALSTFRPGRSCSSRSSRSAVSSR